MADQITLAKKYVAHSIQVFRGRSEVINDLDLMVLFMFLPAADSFKRQSIVWEHTLRHYGPGLIDLRLEDLTESDAKEFLAALRSIRVQLGAFDEKIPRSLLEERRITPGVVFADFPVKPLIEAAMRIENLISAEVVI